MGPKAGGNWALVPCLSWWVAPDSTLAPIWICINLVNTIYPIYLIDCMRFFQQLCTTGIWEAINVLGINFAEWPQVIYWEQPASVWFAAWPLLHTSNIGQVSKTKGSFVVYSRFPRSTISRVWHWLELVSPKESQNQHPSVWHQIITEHHPISSINGKPNRWSQWVTEPHCGKSCSMEWP